MLQRVGTSFLFFFNPTTPTLRSFERKLWSKPEVYKYCKASFDFISMSETTLSTLLCTFGLDVMTARRRSAFGPVGAASALKFNPVLGFLLSSTSTSTGLEAIPTSLTISRNLPEPRTCDLKRELTRADLRLVTCGIF